MQYILGSGSFGHHQPQRPVPRGTLHCSSAVNGLCLIELYPNGRHPTYYTLFICIELGCSSISRVLHDSSYLWKEFLFEIVSLVSADPLCIVLLKFPPSGILIKPVISGSMISNKVSSSCVNWSTLGGPPPVLPA